MPLPIHSSSDWPGIRRLAGAHAASQLEQRQGAGGPDLEDGRQVSAPPAGGGHDLTGQAGAGQPSVGRSADRRLARKEAGAACNRRHGQSHGKDRLVRHGTR